MNMETGDNESMNKHLDYTERLGDFEPTVTTTTGYWNFTYNQNSDKFVYWLQGYVDGAKDGIDIDVIKSKLKELNL